MIPVVRRTGESHTAGLAKLREMIERRAGSDLTSYFDTESAIERLSQVSGGFERQLLQLCQRSIFATPVLPITRQAVDAAIRDERDIMATGLSADSWKKLRAITTDTLPQDLDAQLLEYHYVLEYRDEQGYWLAVNPLIREAALFSRSGAG